MELNDWVSKDSLNESKEKILRLKVKGKFITYGGQKFYIKGVTYGTFRPVPEGIQFPSPEMVSRDFSLMKANGINTVRTYTVPPLYLLEAADVYGLKVMVGLPWEQHLTFLDSGTAVSNILFRVKQMVNSCRNHPAVLCYTIGNEIPATIVRWYGKKKIERFLHRLFKAVKSIDGQALVTYVNFPTTEYLQLPFLDFDCFNVYLETKVKLESYLQRLHNLTGDRPLVLAEIGFDSRRNGESRQADVLDWQVRTIFAKGCAGAFVFAWTDEWWRGGFDIEDWDFGLVDRSRNPKPALATVSQAFSDIPFSEKENLPLISVLICSRNGGATIRDTMEALLKVDYPNFEVIVVNDGSTDELPQIVSEYPFRLISTSNRGLSNARNTAMMEASGVIVAYLDDDAYPDPQWLRYLAYAYSTSSHAGIGGPNIAPDNDGPIATCVAHAPGGPVHVLTTDEIAEHIPGCNMSFRREALIEIGGFDPVFRTAGDDVDICWRLQHTGRSIGFHPGAFVWHHRRNSVKAFWKQQKGYGKAEALLEAKWPEKYNGMGHLSWEGRIYGNGIALPVKIKKDRIFHGVWGSAPFQSIYEQAQGTLSYLPLMPEWYLLIIVLGSLSILGLSWQPLIWLVPVFLLALLILFFQAGVSAAKSLRFSKFSGRMNYLKYWGLTTLLHIIQPLARLYGRITHGLAPWRKRGSRSLTVKLIFKSFLTLYHWSETWRSGEDWLSDIEANLIKVRTRVRRGGQFDSWDLEVACGFSSSARGLLTIEEYGGGKQMLKFKCRPHQSGIILFLIVILASLSGMAAFDKSYLASLILGIISSAMALAYFLDKARALHDLSKAFDFSRVTEAVPEDMAESVVSFTKNEEREASLVRSVIRNPIPPKNEIRWDSRYRRVLNMAVNNKQE